ncbi:FadR/GntR family transcriptional regulator [Marinomonas mediterranea]|jgi:Transcriptional regulators|uniref:GntR domain protein n=1 Tax=Marinomonas mediterranea (strain ATCC 700492 / JCM 21426 / NBRC 103028 / MMB-1) TaxID=717774 RepID=F2JVB2_MARM1|nr:FadR/GntR family transcriptional regulator [Marinomonas mediterranea]ADZ89370.1 GntR domain protein [Marinomonas mediterranea MMB-1]WCN15634.1 FCD domain-containing protein [Marinomonas mediterranea MMB-1]
MNNERKKSIKRSKTSLPELAAERIREKIRTSNMSVGDKLPTEPNLMKELGVSRTVLREAMMTLKAEGWVLPKQGIGVFVAEPKPMDFSGFSASDTLTISDAIESLELRTAVEVEAVALAVSRRSAMQESDICRSFDAFEKKVALGKSAEQEDYEFHLAIARATNNDRFVKFLDVLGKKTIPRARLREEAGLPRDPNLEQTLNEEHKAILDALLDRDVERARDAMRTHLTNGCNRYRDLARAIQKTKS